MIRSFSSSLPRRRLIASAIALFVAGMTMLTPAFAAEPKVLIGLGDSYSSGLGNANTGACGRSEVAFPTLAAKWLDAEGENFACSGATAEAFDQPFDGQGPQLDLLRQAQASTGVDYVALTVGGNDIGVLRGVAGLLSGEALPSFGSKIQAEVPNLTSAYKEIRVAAPNADVYVLGYPNIFPTDNSVLEECIGTDLGGRVDLANGVTAFNLMNSGLESAVDATGDSRIHFVPVDTFGGHDFCSSDPWAYGLTGRGLLHPNEAGHDEMARLLANAITETPEAPAATSTSTSTTNSTSSSVAPTSTSSTVAPTSTSTTAVELQEVPVVPIVTTPSTITPGSTPTTRPELTEVTTPSTVPSSPTTVALEVTEISTAPTTSTTARPTTTTTSRVQPTTTSTSAAPVAVAAPTSTTSTAAPEVLAETADAPTLAYTGASTTSYLALAFLLTGIGLSLMWFRLQQRDRMARIVIPVKVKR